MSFSELSSSSSSSSVCLVMIVKNESAIIERCLTSVMKIIDYVSISDTGSTDSTVEIIHRVCRDAVKTGQLKGYNVMSHEWKHFGHNRTMVTRETQKWLLTLPDLPPVMNDDGHEDQDPTGPMGEVSPSTVILSSPLGDEHDPDPQQLSRLSHITLLFLDADMVFWVHPTIDEHNARLMSGEKKKTLMTTFESSSQMVRVWKDALTKFKVILLYQYSGDLIYPNIRCIRGDMWVTCHCPTHEYYSAYDPLTGRDVGEKTFVHDCSIEDIGDGGSKHDKFLRDVRLLSDAIVSEPDNTRYWFYLGNSYKNSGQLDKAIDAYKRRIELQGWEEEVFMSWLYMGECYEVLKKNSDAMTAYLQGYNALPKRAETLYRASVLCRKLGLYHISKMFSTFGKKVSYPHGSLFVESSVYEYLFDEEVSIYGYYTGDKEEGKLACEKILSDTTCVPVVHKNLAASNAKFYT